MRLNSFWFNVFWLLVWFRNQNFPHWLPLRIERRLNCENRDTNTPERWPTTQLEKLFAFKSFPICDSNNNQPLSACILAFFFSILFIPIHYSVPLSSPVSFSFILEFFFDLKKKQKSMICLRNQSFYSFNLKWLKRLKCFCFEFFFLPIVWEQKQERSMEDCRKSMWEREREKKAFCNAIDHLITKVCFSSIQRKFNFFSLKKTNCYYLRYYYHYYLWLKTKQTKNTSKQTNKQTILKKKK